MPNWCLNKVTLTASPELIDQVIEKAKDGLFNGFVPMPSELQVPVPTPPEVAEGNLRKHGFANWYDFAHEMWGTKWDVTDKDITFETVQSDDNLAGVALYFATAWSPPTAFYEAISGLGFHVEAFYVEPLMGFFGRYESVEGDKTVEFTEEPTNDEDKAFYEVACDAVGYYPEE